jgi:hypothetical protein
MRGLLRIIYDKNWQLLSHPITCSQVFAAHSHAYFSNISPRAKLIQVELSKNVTRIPFDHVEEHVVTSWRAVLPLSEVHVTLLHGYPGPRSIRGLWESVECEFSRKTFTRSNTSRPLSVVTHFRNRLHTCTNIMLSVRVLPSETPFASCRSYHLTNIDTKTTDIAF